MEYSYHLVYYGEGKSRYRVIAIDVNSRKIVYERIYNKEEDAKSYIREQNAIEVDIK